MVRWRATPSRPPDPTILNAEPRPDWYLLWYFALLALLPHALEDYFIILGPLLFVAFLLVPPLFFNKGERSPLLRPWAIALVIGIWTTIGTLWLEGVRAPWSPDFTAKPLPASVIGTNTGPVYDGAQLFHSKGCEYCHEISGYGGHRGPSLTYVGERLTKDQMTFALSAAAPTCRPLEGPFRVRPATACGFSEFGNRTKAAQQ